MKRGPAGAGARRSATVGVHDVVAFFVEICALVLLGAWAWRMAPGAVLARSAALVVVIGAAVLLWSLFAAPRATFDMPVAAIAVKALVLGGSVLAAYAMVPVLLATCFAVLVVINAATVTMMRLT